LNRAGRRLGELREGGADILGELVHRPSLEGGSLEQLGAGERQRLDDRAWASGSSLRPGEPRLLQERSEGARGDRDPQRRRDRRGVRRNPRSRRQFGQSPRSDRRTCPSRGGVELSAGLPVSCMVPGADLLLRLTSVDADSRDTALHELALQTGARWRAYLFLN